MSKKIIKRTEGGETLYFGTHSDAVQVGEGNEKDSLTNWMAGQESEILTLVDGGAYNSTSKKIELKHGDTVLAEIDATAFIKDGMVSSVTITGGNLVITFNTDAGQEPISIPLTDIFNPANYYTKTQVDEKVPTDVSRTATDAAFVNSNTDTLFWLHKSDATKAGLMTADEHNKLDSLPTAQDLNTSLDSIIYDVSAKNPTAGPNNDGKFTLEYILNQNNVDTLIPSAIRKGGMSIKFVLSSDNKYVLYNFLLSGNFSVSAFTSISNWQYIGSLPYSPFPYTKSYTPYLTKRLKELYLTGLNSEHIYYIGVFYSNSGTSVLGIYDSADDTEVARADIHTLKGLSVISEKNNSGISGYAVVNIDSTDISGSSLHLELVNNIVSNIDFSPTIKSSLASFNSGQKLTETKIINDTTTGGVNDVASAEVTKNLNKDIKDLTQELHKVVLSYPTIRLFQVRVDNAATNATYETAGNGMGTFPVSKGDIVEFTENSDYAGEIGLLQNLDNVEDGNLVPFMTGTSLIAVAKGVKETVIVPDDGYFFFNRSTNASRDGSPSALVIKKLISKTQIYLQDCADYKVLVAGKNTTSTTATKQIIFLTNIPTIPNGAKYKVIVSGLPDTDKIRFYLNGSSSAKASVGNGEHEFTATSDITQFNVKSAASETSVESDVEVKLVIDDIKAIVKNNEDDIQQLKNSTMPKIGIEDLQSAAGVSGNDFTENFTVYVDSALFKTSNSIFSCTAKYTTSDAGIVPTLRFSYGNSVGTTLRQKYIIGTKDEFEEKQWRFPKMVGYNIIRIEFLIPTGVTLTIKDFSVALDNSVNRDTFRFFEHSISSNVGEFNTVGAFTYAAEMGYYGAIVVPKFTSDGVIVCYHDDSFGDNPNVEMIDGTELPTTSIGTSTYAQVCGMQYVSTNRLGEHPRIPTFETFIKICAKTGIHPCLSCHPYIDENGWRAIKSITDKYHVTDKLTIKHTPVVGSTNYQAIIHNVFGDGIECYLPDVSTDNLSNIITQFGSVNWDLDKVKVGVEFMNPTYAANALARETGGINDLVAAGYVWGVFENVPDATTLKTLIDAGCYEWTISDFYSSGLNW